MSHRLSDDQIEADRVFIAGLKSALPGWVAELGSLQLQIVDQAILDAKNGHQSDIYKTLENREKELQGMIEEGSRKLGLVSERYHIGPISGMISQVLTKAKPTE